MTASRWTKVVALLALFDAASALAPTRQEAASSGGAQGAAPELGPVDARAIAAQLEAERRAWRARERELLERVGALEAELTAEQELRLAREQEWLEFTRVLEGLTGTLPAPPPAFIAEALVPPPDPEAEAAAAARAKAEARGLAMLAALRVLLAAEQVPGLDVLELGVPHEHLGRGVVGPVVARLVDDRGRLVGGLAAPRLWLEASRAARSITLVFEDGYETRGGARTEFELVGGRRLRRWFLPSVDPAPWIEALPELVDPASARGSLDDGRYDVVALRRDLDTLLRDAAAPGGAGWRLRALGGVLGDTLCDVQLVEYAASGAVERRLFADRAEVELDGPTVRLVLREGTQERAGRIAPFLDGRYVVVLPHADVAQWRAAGLPGGGESNASPEPPGPAASTPVR